MNKKKKNMYTAIVAIAVAMAFIMPVAAVANFGTFGVTSNSENTNDIKDIKETASDNSDSSDNTEVAIEETNTDTIMVPLTRGTIYVDDDADPGWYDATHVKTIQEGINNATVGDTVHVYNGTYYERLIVNKTVDLIGESRENVIINANGTGETVFIESDNVSFTSFTLENGNYGVYVYAPNVTIQDCEVYGHTARSFFSYEAPDTTFKDCISHDNKDAMYLMFSPNTIIENCHVYNNTGYAFYLRGRVTYETESYTITNSTAYNHGNVGLTFYQAPNSKAENCTTAFCWAGISVTASPGSSVENYTGYNNTGAGISVGYSPNTNVTNCVIYNNNGNGIDIADSPNSNFENCEAYNNNYGIRLRESSDSNITNCEAYENDKGIQVVQSSNSNVKNCDLYNNLEGIDIYRAPENNMMNCSVYENEQGISIERSSETSLKNNGFYDNTYNFNVVSNVASDYYQDIDTSNTVSGKPILYLNFQSNQVYDERDSYGFIGMFSCSNITVKNLDLEGIVLAVTTDSTFFNVSSHNSITGFYLYESSNNDISECVAYNNKDGINIAGNSAYNNVTSCTAYDNNGQGIYIYTASNTYVTGCDVYDNVYGISIYNSPYSNLNGNTLYNNSYNFYVSGNFEQTIDTSNTINGKTMYYIVGQSNLTFDASDDPGWLGLITCTSITVNDVDVYGLLLVGTTDSMISGVSSSKSRYGVYLAETSGNNIVNSMLYNNVYGAYGRYSSDNFTDCKAYDNSDYGFYLYHASDNIINCDIYNNGNYGIRLYYDGTNNIENCNIHNNPEGIQLYRSTYNTIIYCNFYENDRGVHIYRTSDNNLIHHNNFANNPSYNASDACSNTWDNGTEGNYWGDYTGVDVDGDGIGDTPYNIPDGSNVDNYPLMEPVLLAPELFSPPDGSATEDQTPTFDWTDVPALYPVTYSLQVANDSGFTTIVVNEIGLMESEYTPTTMGYDTYYWKVKAMVGVYDTGWSDVWSFTVELDLVPPTTPDLIEPADNSTIVTSVVFFDWSDSYDVYGIDYYTLQVATDDVFDDVVSEVTPDESECTLALTTPDDYYWRVKAVDNNGLFSDWSEVRMFTRLVDTSPPVVELFFPVGGEYLSGSVIITWSATDDLTPDDDLLIKIEYRYGGPWQTLALNEENDGEYLWDTTGYPDGAVYKIKISTEDYWGKSGSDESYTTFTVDNTDPVTTAYLDPSSPDGENNWYTSDVQVTLVATDETSGIDYTKYKIDDGAWEIYVVPLTVSDDGEHTVEYYSVDNAGNEETINEVAFKIDQTVPTIDLTWDEENSKLVADVDDETSGVAKVEFYVNGELLGEVTEAPYEWEVSDPQSGDVGQAIVYDNAGNDVISEEIDAVSQSQSQSISSSPVSFQISSWLFGLL